MIARRPHAKVLPYTRARQVAQDLSVIQRRHVIHALIEADVTQARALLDAYASERGESLSFTAYVIWCVAQAVSEQSMLQAYRLGRRRMIVFEDVDVNMLMERQAASHARVVSHVIRAAQRKSALAIHHEIRCAQHARAHRRAESARLRLYDALPQLMRRTLVRLAAHFPSMWKRVAGTVVVTAVGMYGKGGGWGIPTVWNTLAVTVGGIGVKPGVVNGQVAVREYLNLTISADHNVVDGTAVAAFASRLRERLESADGLQEALRERAAAVSADHR
jgi:pyruvate/2-oxoglutarate dehydrogenase complex dihydrolipoamide acyltransferase (E2) component